MGCVRFAGLRKARAGWVYILMPVLALFTLSRLQAGAPNRSDWTVFRLKNEIACRWFSYGAKMRTR